VLLQDFSLSALAERSGSRPFVPVDPSLDGAVHPFGISRPDSPSTVALGPSVDRHDMH
jgi:hypothetical protein